MTRSRIAVGKLASVASSGLARSLGAWTAGLVAAALLVALPSSVSANWPPDESAGTVDYSNSTNWPNDPGYAGNWTMWSFLPRSIASRPGVSDENKRLGTGAWLDKAWARTTGDRRVLISVLDSGSNWSNGDLVNKWFLNRGELTAPDAGCKPLNAGGDAYDVNGDGVFNTQDYADATVIKGTAVPAWTAVCDTRLKTAGDVNGNGIIDPQDLIHAFSDGKDDDANGYIDDISGWDFYHNDNDAFDDTNYGHGDGESSESSNEGNNGRGNIGTCPECSVELLRVGDSFIADANIFGLAVTYAVDIGTSVITEALGTIDNTLLGKDAIDYAYKNNVAVIASAADENSFHHNMPGTNNHTYYIHANTFDSEGGWENATTFLNFNNCTNYGANLLAASMPAANCSSGAVSRLGGVTGLIYAAALKADVPYPASAPVAGDPNRLRRLTAEEVYQILSTTADDLYDPADASDPTRYPTRVGWEQRFGYGRINARHAVDAVMDGTLPPQVEFRSPEWFDVLFPERTGKVTLDGRIEIGHSAPSDTFDYTLEWAPGVEPNDTDWKTITSATMVGAKIDGPLADWDISSLTINNPTQGPPDGLTNRRAVTLRLRATMHSTSNPKREGKKGEARRAVFIEHDPDVLPGWPIHVRSSGEMNGKIADLLGDGKREFVFSDSVGVVHAFKFDGTELTGWPVKVEFLPGLDPKSAAGHTTSPAFTTGGLSADRHGATAFSIAIGDVDGDKKPDVIVGSYYGQLWAFHADGSVLSGFPFTIDMSTATKTDPTHILYEGILAAPALTDLNGDGRLDIVVATMNSLLYVIGGDGKPLPSWNGGQPLMIWDTRLPDDPKAATPRKRDRIVSSPAIGDLNGDGTPDIVLGSNENYDDIGRLYVVDGKTATYMPGWPINLTSKYLLPEIGSGVPNAPALADFDGDGVPEIVINGIAGAVRVIKANGKPYSSGDFGGSFPNNLNSYGPGSDAKDQITIGMIASCAIGDLNDDGVLDVFSPTAGIGNALGMANGGIRTDAEHHVCAWDSATGKFLPGFPRHIEDFQFFNNPTVADVDGDGHSEVLESSGGYWVHAWRADGTEAMGFPKLTGNWVTTSVAIGDMDGDGFLEVALTTREGWAWAWKTKGKANGRIDWPSFHHDLMNTGNFATPLDEGVRSKPGMNVAVDAGMMQVVGGGCSCAVGRRSAATSAGATLILLLVGGAFLLRRRSARRS